MRFRAKNGANRKQIALTRANQIVGSTSDFKMDVIKESTSCKNNCANNC